MKNINYYFPLHLDSGNRGCEAITRGTLKVLGIKKKQYIGKSWIQSNDNITGLSEEISYNNTIDSNVFYKFEWIFLKIVRKLSKNSKRRRKITYSHEYDSFLRGISRNDIVFITGGDLMCYGDSQINYIVPQMYKKGIKTVLWGCSMGKENLSPEKKAILQQFTCITARESMTYNFLKNDMRLENVHLFPDPAFTLDTVEYRLPEFFQYDCIGINLSNFTNVKVDKETIFGKNIINLFDYILTNTSYHIVLIPHVFWDGQDDREICKYFCDLFDTNARVHLLNTEKMNYCEIRFAISKCRFFLGARTHAMISAYSTCVPSIALGYSIKSKGIASDLNMPEFAILDYRELKDENEITARFKMLQSCEMDIRRILIDEMTEYKAKAYEAKACIDEIIANGNE